ncbi:NTP transferase domain-containing protein [Candidatus Omnitrophota bacterium]
MKKYNVIILAGGEEEAWCQHYGFNKKSFLPIMGKPMLARVIEAFHGSKFIDNIVVIGPKGLNQLDSIRLARKHLSERNSFAQNLFFAALYIKAMIYRFAGDHNGYVVSFCDAALLTTGVIDATLKNIAESDPEIALHYVQKETISRAGHPVENRSFMLVAGKHYTGSVIYYIKSFTKLLRLLNEISLVRKYRKEPGKILQYIGCEDKDIPGIESELSSRLSTKVKVFVSPYAEMGVDVDKASDYELAKAYLQRKQRQYAESKHKKGFDVYTESGGLDAEF